MSWLLGTSVGRDLIVAIGTAAATSAGHWFYHLAMRDKRTQNLANLAEIAADIVEAGLRGAVVAPDREKLMTYATIAVKDRFIARYGDIKKCFGGEADYVVHGAVVKEVGIGNVTVNLPDTTKGPK